MEYLLIRLGIVGAGTIVQSHIDAARLSGFAPVAICGRMGSPRAAKIAQQNKGLVAVSDLNDLLKSKLDAILIAVSIGETIDVLEKCLVGRLPILVEKPVSTDERILQKLYHRWGDQVLVGYNRRHYSSTKKFRETLAIKEKGLIGVNISELSLASQITKEERRQAILTNSVHILDLMNYLFGDIRLLNTIKSPKSTRLHFLTWQFESSKGYCGNINLLFGTPENQSVTQWSKSFFQELRPIEMYSSSDSMHMIPPTKNNPVKSYKKILQPWLMSEVDLKVKPGFLGEYSEFRELCLGKKMDKRISANLQDAANAVKIAHKIYSL